LEVLEIFVRSQQVTECTIPVLMFFIGSEAAVREKIQIEDGKKADRKSWCSLLARSES